MKSTTLSGSGCIALTILWGLAGSCSLTPPPISETVAAPIPPTPQRAQLPTAEPSSTSTSLPEPTSTRSHRRLHPPARLRCLTLPGSLRWEWPLITRQNAEELTSVGCKSIPASRIYAFNLPAQLVAAEVNGALVVSDLGGLAAPIELGPTASLNEYATLAFSSQGSGLLDVDSNSATVYAPFDPASPHSFVGRDWTVRSFLPRSHCKDASCWSNGR